MTLVCIKKTPGPSLLKMSAAVVVPETPPFNSTPKPNVNDTPSISLTDTSPTKTIYVGAGSKRARPAVLYFPFAELAEFKKRVEPWFNGVAISSVSSLGTDANYLVTLRTNKEGTQTYTVTDENGVRHAAQSIEEHRARELIEHIGERGSAMLFNLIKRGEPLANALARVLEQDGSQTADCSQTTQADEPVDSGLTEEEKRLGRAEECSARNML